MKKRLFAILVMLVMALSVATVSALATDGSVTISNVTAANVSTGTKATVSWKASGTVDHYTVGVESGTTKKTVKEVKGSATSQVLETLAPGEYVFYVEAFDTEGNSIGKGTTKLYLVMAPVKKLALYPAYKSI
ncbi:MAG: fibronectin type III domain-containing protein, partial [Mogibacterium sp.]|nr:fibronectin type III domain-containing protein [Mogibacterium sp.]